MPTSTEIPDVPLKPSDLPDTARAIADVIGVPATLILAEAASNKASSRRGRYYVPTLGYLTPEHRIVQLIGMEAAAALSAIFGGEDIIVPNCRPARRIAAIWTAYMGGATEQEVARSVGLSLRRIRQVTALERGPLADGHHSRIGRLPRSPERAAKDRLNGLQGGRSTIMIRQLIATIFTDRKTPYGTILIAVEAFSPQFFLESKDASSAIPLDRVVEIMATRLPAEASIRHGDSGSILTLDPARPAANRGAIVIKIITSAGPKALTSNGFIAQALLALAHSAAIDRHAAGAQTPSQVTEE